MGRHREAEPGSHQARAHRGEWLMKDRPDTLIAWNSAGGRRFFRGGCSGRHVLEACFEASQK